jgi:3-oxoacyl-[acyl-carrier-protein] synthase II
MKNDTHAKNVAKVMKRELFNRVVITGLGVVAPNGIGIDAFWGALEKGKSGIKKIKAFDASRNRCQVGGEITEFEPSAYIDSKKIDRMDRYAQLGIVAGSMALADAAIKVQEGDPPPGVYIGTGLGGMLIYERSFEVLTNKGPRSIHPNAVSSSMPNSLAGHIAMDLGLKGPNIAISTACSSSSHAIGHAFDAIRCARSEMILAGGSEASLSPLTFSAFDAMRVMASDCNDSPEQASKPFDKRRGGLVLAEGAAMMVLEEFNGAMRRGAHIYAEVLGYGANSGGYHIVAPDPTGQDVVRVMRSTLRDADLLPTEIQFISAHATATQANDRVEALALKSIFGDHTKNLAISCVKSMIGHTIGAAGAFGVLAALLAINKGVIHPTINFAVPDPECDLDVTPNIARKREIQTAMINAFGFGSNNACLIIRGVK